VEFALALPLLALVLMLTFLFGWGMMNQQRTWIADRYACWHAIRVRARPTNVQINQLCFANRANPLTVTWEFGEPSQNAGPSLVGTEQNFVNAVVALDTAAGDLAQELVMNHLPWGLRVRVEAQFPTDVKYWQQYSGTFVSRSAREGVEWRWKQMACGAVVADQKLQTLDGALTAMPVPANLLGGFFRTLYREEWAAHE
jgi:hypothetical protein